MKKSYKVKIFPSKGAATIVDLSPSLAWGPTTLNAQPDSRLQLIDSGTGLAPDTIRVNRKGRDLLVSFDGQDQADLIITDFYNASGASQNVLVGESKVGVYHAYIPESGDWSRSLEEMGDGTPVIGMALGAAQIPVDEYIEPAAVGGLAPVAGFMPLVAAPLLLLGALAGSDKKDAAAANPGISPASIALTRAELYRADDTGQSDTDGVTSNRQPRISGTTEPNANVKITIGGHVYEGKANAQGEFLIPITDALVGDMQNYKVTISNATGASATVDGKPFILDTSNQSSSQNVGVNIETISQDTGLDTADFLTRDNTLNWSGTLNTSSATFNPDDAIQIQLLDATTAIRASQYIKPVQSAGTWRWTWLGDTQSLADGQYTLKAQVVDTAGNLLSDTASTRQVTIDTQPQAMWNGQVDPNAAFVSSIGLMKTDTGSSGTDFLSNDRLLTFTGSVQRSTGSGSFDAAAGQVLAELVDRTGKIVAYKYLTPSDTGTWTIDSSSVALGVTGAATSYVLKSFIVDMAGNPMSASSQAFTIDLRLPMVSNVAKVIQAGGTDFTEMSFLADEQGSYFFNGVAQTTGSLSLNGVTHFEAGQFNIRFEDLAGNGWLKSNTQAWDFGHLTGKISLLTTSSLDSGAFDAGQLVGSIGKYDMASTQTLDLSSLHSLSPARDGQGAINHVDMRGNGAQTLKVSITDVLVLGIKNSFSNASDYVDHIQMRIDGDNVDKLTLSKQWGSSNNQNWLAHGQLALDGQMYNAYFNQSLSLEVFVQSAMIVTVI